MNPVTSWIRVCLGDTGDRMVTPMLSLHCVRLPLQRNAPAGLEAPAVWEPPMQGAMSPDLRAPLGAESGPWLTAQGMGPHHTATRK